MYDVEGELREWFRGAGRVVVVGVGNPIRMDDYVGMKIVQDLKGRVNADRVMLIEAETIPENHMQEIIDFKPTHILIIDAAKMELKAGEARLTKPEQLTNYSAFSTHMLPLRIFCEHLAGTIKARIALLLIEPRKTDFGEGLTYELEICAQNVQKALLGLIFRRM
jgi:hydrogenase 3 maturation protease